MYPGQNLTRTLNELKTISLIWSKKISIRIFSYFDESFCRNLIRMHLSRILTRTLVELWADLSSWSYEILTRILSCFDEHSRQIMGYFVILVLWNFNQDSPMFRQELSSDYGLFCHPGHMKFQSGFSFVRRALSSNYGLFCHPGRAKFWPEFSHISMSTSPRTF